MAHHGSSALLLDPAQPDPAVLRRLGARTAAPLALITGVSRPGRVGEATALELASRGCDLLLTSRATPEAEAGAESIARTIAARHPSTTIVRTTMDLAALDDLAANATALAAILPRLDILIHNASWYGPTPLATLDGHAFSAAMNANAGGPLIFSAKLAPLLSKSPLPGGGAIVAMVDIHARGELGQPRREHISYGMSKAALLEMVLVLARELAPSVRCNGVAPGVVAFPTEGHESDSAMQARYLARVPLARSGTPQEAAKAVAFLALDATYTTGQVLAVDGGRSIT